MLKKLSLLVMLLFVFCGCKKTDVIDGYTRNDEGYYFKLLALGDGNEHPAKESVLITDAVMRTQSDSVFWDTFHDGANGFFISLGDDDKGSCHKEFLKLVEGDSASFLIKPAVFFKLYFGTEVPSFCSNDSLIKLNVRINQIISHTDYQEMKRLAALGASEDKELEELQQIDSYLMNNYHQVKPDENGIYTIEKISTNGPAVTYGKRIIISCEGRFIDGKSIDAAPQQMEFIYGTPDQVIQGLNIVIGGLKKGETTKIIVPSRLAFGESGSSNGSVPPYTPIVYNIKIIDIK